MYPDSFDTGLCSSDAFLVGIRWWSENSSYYCNFAVQSSCPRPIRKIVPDCTWETFFHPFVVYHVPDVVEDCHPSLRLFVRRYRHRCSCQHITVFSIEPVATSISQNNVQCLESYSSYSNYCSCQYRFRVKVGDGLCHVSRSRVPLRDNAQSTLTCAMTWGGHGLHSTWLLKR